MNAHTPHRSIASAQPTGAAISAEAIGSRIAAIHRRRSTLDRERLAMAPADRPSDDLEDRRLHDEVEALDLALEYAEPQTLAGVAVQVAQLGVLAEQLAEEGCDDRAELLQRLIRLHSSALEGLMCLGDLDPDEIGVAGKRFPCAR